MEEDYKLKSKKWKNRFLKKRIVFHDNTGIEIIKPSDSFQQRITYSSYYSGNVGKGGVFVQQCGWMGGFELYPGAISDTEYLNNTGILEEQKKFQDNDGGEPFINIIDRGYCSTKAAWKFGQFILQPFFCKSEKNVIQKKLCSHPQ